MTTDKTPMVEEAPPTGEAPRARRWVLVAQVTVAVVELVDPVVRSTLYTPLVQFKEP